MADRQESAFYSGLIWRLVTSVAIVAACLGAQQIYSIAQGTIEGPLAVKQIEDNPVEYTTGRAVAAVNVAAIIGAIGIVGTIIVWVPFAIRVQKQRTASRANRWNGGGL